ncbi:MAG: hypothetical protein FWF69_00030, partial [Firmicutes bacterium]|nr:hypothetical protein [Bacillota bacterium]
LWTRGRKMEVWLEGELRQLRLQLEALQASPRQTRPMTPPPVSRPRHEEPSLSPADLTPIVNDLLADNQPYNFIESLRAHSPHLSLQRLTPRANATFSQHVVLENGGDGLFAYIHGEEALLFPNYSRFSATLDPKPLFDGARHDGRIHSIISPAVLKKTADGAWRLSERGRVLMRQGGD